MRTHAWPGMAKDDDKPAPAKKAAKLSEADAHAALMRSELSWREYLAAVDEAGE
jgi:hypothetical protein